MSRSDDTLVLLLRSVNVGGNRMTMTWLREVAAAAGCADVRSLLATGNLLVARPDDPAALAASLEDQLESHGNRIDVIHRTADELREAVAANPWADDVTAGRREGRFVHTMFLAARPSASATDDLPRTADGDEWDLVGRDVFVSFDGSSRDSRFTGAWFERHLGAGTMRNHNTVLKIVDALDG